MAICDQCQQEMLDEKTVTCTRNAYIKFPDGKIFAASKSHFDEPSGRCHDCNIVHGGYHHPGCDVERCPRCGGQLIGCNCWGLDDFEKLLESAE